MSTETGFEAIGLVDSSLPTIGIFAKKEDKENDDTNRHLSDKVSSWSDFIFKTFNWDFHGIYIIIHFM